MRHFIAMLRDSFHEAIDGWIFLVMLIISGVLILLVASMSVSSVAVPEAIPKMLPQQQMMMVQPNRGDSKRIGLFNYQVAVSDVKTTAPAEKPWQTEASFTLTLTSLGFGGGGVEIEEGKDLKDVKPGDVKAIEGEGLLSDAVKSAVRYWATNPGSAKAEYTDALALEFVKHQVESVSGLRVEKVEKTGSKYRITTTGCESIRWPHEPSLFFGLWKMSFFQQPLGNLVYTVQSILVNGLGAWITLLAGVVVTAGFFPNLLRKGAIDLWLTKPIARPLILLYKYLGGLLFVFLLTAVTVGGVWVMIGLRTGVWNTGFLTCVFAITFYFAILYAMSTLLGVLTRNTIVSIVGTLVFWGLLFAIGTTNNIVTALDNIDSMRTTTVVKPKKDKMADEDKGAKPEGTTQESEPQPEVRVPPTLVTIVHMLNRVTPRTSDLDTLTTLLIGKGIVSEQEQRQARRLVGEIAWAEVIGVSVAYIGLFLGLAMIRFMTRSY
jgi:ABC-type transport system involved in multi-copper enzyme maturation permease subunit